MRRNILGLESHGSSHGFGNISMEEEEMLADAAPQDAADAEAEIAAAERTLDVSEALEDLAAVSDGIEEATPTEAALIDTTAQMAVAGTDIQPEEIVPAMEGYVGRRIATEDLRDRAKTIWEAIKRMLKSIWEKIEGFFYKIFGRVPKLRRTIEGLKKKLEDMSGMKKEENTFEYTSGVSMISIDKVPVKNIGGLKMALGNVATAVKWGAETYVPGVTKTGEKIATAISTFDPQDLSGSAKKVAEAANEFGDIVVPGAQSATIDGWDEFTVTKGAALMGNYHLEGREIKTADAGKATELGKLELLRRSGIYITATREKKDQPSEVTFTTPDIGQMEGLLEDAMKVLDDIEKIKRGDIVNKLAKARESLKKACDKASTASDKAGKRKDEEGKDDNQVQAAYYRAMANFNLTYARWARDPMHGLTINALNSVSACCGVVGASIRQYKKN